MNNNSIQTGMINLASVTTSTFVYHPLRTIATLIVDKQPISVSPKVLYRGWFFCILASHQFFLMRTIKDLLTIKLLETKKTVSLAEKLIIGGISGLTTTVTVTPCEAMTTQRQIGANIDWKDRKIWTRGALPISIRQVGLGLGMFVLPDLLSKDDYELHKIGVNFFGGVTAATITHIPEYTRLLMQTKPSTYPSAKKAFSQAMLDVCTKPSRRLFQIRITVIAIATVMMHLSKQLFTQSISKNFTEKRGELPSL